MTALDRTVLARLTPPGTGAIATVAICGAAAWNIISELFQPAGTAALPAEPMPGLLRFGRLGAAAGDEVVLAVRRGSPGNWLEVHTHGGRQVVDWIIGLIAERGAEPVSWPEFERFAGASPLRVAASEALSRAITFRTADILNDQFHGALESALRRMETELASNYLDQAADTADELLRHSAVGCHLTRPWRVVVAGPPNVGKSSLVNALAGYQRSVVTPIPGTTRDLVTTTLAIDGWPVELVDTAGVRDATETLEGEGIELARRAAMNADLCLWIYDAAATGPRSDGPVPAESRSIPVINKTDLPPAWKLDDIAGAILVSALTGARIDALCNAISNALVPTPPPPGAAVPFSDELVHHIRQIRTDLENRQTESARRSLENLLAGHDPNPSPAST